MRSWAAIRRQQGVHQFQAISARQVFSRVCGEMGAFCAALAGYGKAPEANRDDGQKKMDGATPDPYGEGGDQDEDVEAERRAKAARKEARKASKVGVQVEGDVAAARWSRCKGADEGGKDK